MDVDLAGPGQPRPAGWRPQFRLADAPGGTAVELQIDAHVRPVFLRPWELSQRLFWRRSATWTRRADVG